MAEQPSEWEVAVLGAGPAGLAAAYAAASGGARTIVLERSAHPRYKTCGGGLIGASIAAASQICVPASDHIQAAIFTHNGRRAFTHGHRGEPLLAMVRREDFDAALLRAAINAGAVVYERSAARAIEQDDERVHVRLANGSTVAAPTLIGADGSAGISARHVGVSVSQVDLGLELELPVPDASQRRWRNRILIDWEPIRSSYGWVFPKGDVLTVGVIAPRGMGEQTKVYLRRFVDRLGFSSIVPVRDTGHLTGAGPANRRFGGDVCWSRVTRPGCWNLGRVKASASRCDLARWPGPWLLPAPAAPITGARVGQWSGSIRVSCAGDACAGDRCRQANTNRVYQAS